MRTFICTLFLALVAGCGTKAPVYTGPVAPESTVVEPKPKPEPKPEKKPKDDEHEHGKDHGKHDRKEK